MKTQWMTDEELLAVLDDVGEFVEWAGALDRDELADYEDQLAQIAFGGDEPKGRLAASLLPLLHLLMQKAEEGEPPMDAEVLNEVMALIAHAATLSTYDATEATQ
jgi:hypothetical protein